jgi:hypothetical protein
VFWALPTRRPVLGLLRDDARAHPSRLRVSPRSRRPGRPARAARRGAVIGGGGPFGPATFPFPSAFRASGGTFVPVSRSTVRRSTPSELAMGGHYRSTSGSHRAGRRPASTCSVLRSCWWLAALAPVTSSPALASPPRPTPPGIPLAAAATRATLAPIEYQGGFNDAKVGLPRNRQPFHAQNLGPAGK